MPETPDTQPDHDDPAFVQTVMYHGRTSRRPGLRLLLGVAFGLVIAASGGLLYADLAQWERAGQPERRMPGPLVTLYEIGGKGLVLSLFIAFAAFLLVTVARAYLVDRHAALGQTDRRPGS